jgi:hypothetical protein
MLLPFRFQMELGDRDGGAYPANRMDCGSWISNQSRMRHQAARYSVE